MLVAGVALAQTPAGEASAQTPAGEASAQTPAGEASARKPAGVVELFRVAALALSDQDTDRFFSLFDPDMEGLTELRREVALLVALEGAASTIEFASDTGDDERREVEVRWLLRVGDGAAKRGLVKCTLVRREGKWKIAALAPVDFFAMDGQR